MVLWNETNIDKMPIFSNQTDSSAKIFKANFKPKTVLNLCSAQTVNAQGL